MTQTHATPEARSEIRSARRGAVHRWRQTLIPTTREVPSDATTISHQLCIRAGLIRQVGAGIYDYLPLGWRVIQRICELIREEMDAAGASELLLPALEPIELFKGSKRDIDYGPLLFKLEDRHGRVAALGPTHEEVITELMKSAVTSYKQLPLTLYQIQTKFRDEFRPRAGLLRGREFLMKDAYSFHLNVEGPGGLDEVYDAQHAAYERIFRRTGLDFTIVEAESGPIGGSASHEFMVNAESGEDTILVCDASGYAANVEKCEIGERKWSLDGAGPEDLVKHHTPNLPGIDGVAEHLKLTAADMLKCVVFEPAEESDRESDGPRWIVAVVRGDHDANEGKVRDASGVKVKLADDKAARAAGFAIGYVSPKAAASIERTMLVIDPDAAQAASPNAKGWATGADEKDHHVTGFSWSSDLAPALGAKMTEVRYVKVADCRNAVAGDPSPRGGGTLREQRGIEVGHIFKLGTKYSAAMGFEIMNQDQKREAVIMGCYGLGVSRTLAATIEQRHDDNGILWPVAIAPYHVEIVLMKPEDEKHAEACERLSRELCEAGADVLIDDRAERPGVKFKDADLIGIPVRVTIGDKALEQGGVELKARADEGKGELVPLGEAVARCLAMLGA
ncbi:MAG: proline--tRNA ligase [Phycisphaerales bacterium]|nr:MAG: proline--tRNA ligase [Phycisphaerales bacterium]